MRMISDMKCSSPCAVLWQAEGPVAKKKVTFGKVHVKRKFGQSRGRV